MSQAGQRLDPTRYTIVPRTLSFVLRRDQVLLLRMRPDRGEWAGKLNGLGGHIEVGEDVLSSARREIREEAGLSPGDLRLCGVVLIDTGQVPGIGLYVCVGEVSDDVQPQSGAEGELVWAGIGGLAHQLLVEDLPVLLPRAIDCYRRQATFSARYQYRADGTLHISFGD
jgi:8-oxo-dGTP diphosphatase